MSSKKTDGEEAQAAAPSSPNGAALIAPAMIGMQFGSLVGHLARRTLGKQYLLLIPAVTAATNSRS